MPLSPQEELELIELEQESRRRARPSVEQSNPRGMNFTPDPTAESVRQQYKERGEFIPPSELQQAVEPLAAGVIGGLTSDVVAPPQQVLEDSPGTVMAGEVLGGIAQGAMLPAKKAIDAASGAVSGFNAAQGGIPQKLIGGLFGASVNVVGGGAAKGLVKGTKSAARGVSRIAGKLGEGLEKLSLGIRQSDVFRFAAKGKKQAGESVGELVSTLKNAGIFKRGASPEALELSLKEIHDVSAARLDDAFSSLDNSGYRIPTSEVVETLDEHIADLSASPSGFEDEINKLNKFREDIVAKPATNASHLRKLSQIYGTQAFAKDGSGIVVNEEAFKAWQSVKNAIDTLASKVEDKPLGAEIRDANKLYSTAIKARPAIARKAAAGEAGAGLYKQAKGLVEQVTTPVVAGSVEWVKKNSDKLSKMKIYGPILHGAASRSPQALAATYYRLSQQYPDFKEQVEALDE